MKIESVRIENLRSFEDVTVPLNDYTCLVGPNGAGKSTVLYAFNIFFRESANLGELDQKDFHQRNTKNPIRITVTFTDLCSEAKKDFADYFRQEKLIISAVATFDEDTEKAEVKQYGLRLGMTDFKKFFESEKNKKSLEDLKTIFNNLRKTHPDLPTPTSRAKKAMSESLRQYEDERQNECEPIPSEDQFYGFSKGANRLAKYVQWVYVPAVKDATGEQMEERNSALGKLLARTVRLKVNFNETIKNLRDETQRKYQELLLDQNQSTLDEISGRLQERIIKWSHPDANLSLHWEQNPDKSVLIDEPFARVKAREGNFEGQLECFGHGFQRSYLFALLEELANSNDEVNPLLLLACEEPELYQHPPQVRYLSDVFSKISSENSQIIVCTHNPLFVSGKGFEDIRMVRKNVADSHSSISRMSYEQISEDIAKVIDEKPPKPKEALIKIHQALQPVMNEMFFAHRLVLVEGEEDRAYILTYLNLLGKFEDYRRMGCHIVPVGGKNQLLRPIAIAKRLKIPSYVIFDADANKERNREQNKKNNEAILTLSGNFCENPMPDKIFWGKGITMWHSNIGSVVKDEIGEEIEKKILRIGEGLSSAWNKGKRSSSMKKLCAEILNESNKVTNIDFS